MPTIKATLLQIRSGFESGSLKRLAEQSLPVRVSYWLGRVIEAAEKEFSRTETIRVDLIKKYGEQSGDGGQWQVAAEKMTEFAAEFAELLSELVELSGRKLTLDELEIALVTPVDMMTLGWLIDDGETEAEATEAKAAAATAS